MGMGDTSRLLNIISSRISAGKTKVLEDRIRKKKSVLHLLKFTGTTKKT